MAYRKVPFVNVPPRHRRRLHCRESTQLDLHSVAYNGESIFVHVAKKSIHVQKWINYVHLCYGASPQILIGLDTEWLPNTLPGEDHPTAIIQLCVGHHCLIFQLLHSDGIPESLHLFLGDCRHVFCGVGIEGDIKKLYEHHGLWVRRYADLNDLRRLSMGEDKKTYRYMGLKKMAMAVLGKEMKKPLEVTMSKWDSVDLDADQIEYAAIDAYVSFQLGFTLSMILNRNFCISLMQLTL